MTAAPWHPFIVQAACPRCCVSCYARGRIDGQALTVTGPPLAENVAGSETIDREVIRKYEEPLQKDAGFLVLQGNLFDFAIMKTSVISEDFHKRFLAADNAFEGRVVVFDGSTDYHDRINDPSLEIDERTILVIRGAGPLGWPGSAEVVNMQPPDALIARGIMSLPTLGDGRQSGTSDSPSNKSATVLLVATATHVAAHAPHVAPVCYAALTYAARPADVGVSTQ